MNVTFAYIRDKEIVKYGLRVRMIVKNIKYCIRNNEYLKEYVYICRQL